MGWCRGEAGGVEREADGGERGEGREAEGAGETGVLGLGRGGIEVEGLVLDVVGERGEGCKEEGIGFGVVGVPGGVGSMALQSVSEFMFH